MTTMMATPSDVFDAWAQVYDEQPNPLLTWAVSMYSTSAAVREDGFSF
jgi:hypothetical protein